jgi:hypothetical protein
MFRADTVPTDEEWKACDILMGFAPDPTAIPDPALLGPVRLSQSAFLAWLRCPDGAKELAAAKDARGGLFVRCQAPRQRWPARTMEA